VHYKHLIVNIWIDDSIIPGPHPIDDRRNQLLRVSNLFLRFMIHQLLDFLCMLFCFILYAGGCSFELFYALSQAAGQFRYFFAAKEYYYPGQDQDDFPGA